MFVNLGKMPSQPKQYQITLGALYGGLNTSRVPSEIRSTQLSDALNMYWRDGMVRSRPGLVTMEHTEYEGENPWHLHGDSVGYVFSVQSLAMHDKPWHDALFMAFVDEDTGYIVAYRLDTKRYETVLVCSDLSINTTQWGAGSGGDFFEFGGNLYYKNVGAYICITAAGSPPVFSAAAVVPYTPITQINVNSEGVGDLYQPENRISAQKEIWYNGDPGVEYAEFPCDGVQTVFYLPVKLTAGNYQDGDLRSVDQVYIGADLGTEGTDYTVSLTAGTVTTTTAPPLGMKLSVKYTVQRFIYKLPVEDVDSIVSVKVKTKNDQTQQYEYVGYDSTSSDPREGEYMYSNGALYFYPVKNLAPNDVDANVLNTWIKVIYSKANTDAYNSVMRCNIATAFGAVGIETNCIVMAGTLAQSNAIFWSGNDANGANPAYFPMTHYNLAGDASDPITAFGRQQNRLVIFQKNRLSAAEFTFTYVDTRLEINLLIKQINDRIGCDLPHSVQLIDNNLVWANTRYGVLYLKDSTYAYETLIAQISENVNETNKVDGSDGLISLLQACSGVCSADDGERYWLFVRKGTNLQDRSVDVFVWDYYIQPYTSDKQKLCWWKQNVAINTFAWAIHDKQMYGLSEYISTGSIIGADSDCWLVTFDDTNTDLGVPFRKYIQLPTQTFGTYDRLKNVNKMLVAVDAVKHSYAKIIYRTDWEERRDRTDIDTGPDEDRRRILNAVQPDAIQVRRPKCIHVHTFAVRFESDKPYEMNMLTCQLLYTYGARTKAGLRI